MASQTNIFSFADARATARPRRASSDESTYSSARRSQVRRLDDSGPIRMPSSRTSRIAQKPCLVDVRRFEDGLWEPDEQLEAEPNRQAGAETNRRPESKRERRRRERAKARADKMFSKQFEGSAPSYADEEGTPRAALYEGKMGSSHRRSARMQRASSALPQSAKLNPVGWFSGLHVSARALRAGTALLCLVLVAVFLYTPARQYYQAQREHDKLAAEYALVEQRNEAISSQNTTLSSNAGMEDAVREKYGYVVKGDQTAVVTGLSDATTDSARDPDGIEANVLSSTIKAPEEWYTPYLDAFFGVS